MSDTGVLPTNDQFDGWDYLFPGGEAGPTFETATLPRQPVEPVTRDDVIRNGLDRAARERFGLNVEGGAPNA